MIYKQLFFAIATSLFLHAMVILPVPIHMQYAKVDSDIISIDIVKSRSDSAKKTVHTKIDKLEKINKVTKDIIPAIHKKQSTDIKQVSLPDDINNNGITSSSNIAVAHKIYKPVYPALARKKGYDGVIKLLAILDVNRAVKEIKIISSTGYNILDKSALEAVKKSEFVGDDRQVELTFIFRLDDE